MRWKLLRRRLSISAPRVIVRRHLPWPLRWAAAALVFGFSAAIALWAFELGKDIAGLDRDAKEELARLRVEVAQLREAAERAGSLAQTAESLLGAERATHERLAQQIREIEADKLALQADLAFFEQLLPSQGSTGVSVRSLKVSLQSPGLLRYQLLVMQSGRTPAEFKGRYELLLSGTLDARPWTQPLPGGGRPLVLGAYARADGTVEHPAAAVVKSVQVKVLDAAGAVRAAHTVKL